MPCAMQTVTEINTRQIAEWETLVAELGREMTMAKRKIELLRGALPALAPRVPLPAVARQKTAPSPIDAIERIVPKMPHGFSCPDVLLMVYQERPEHNFKKESIRGAFRSYMKRADCRYALVPSTDGVNRYGLRAAASSLLTDLQNAPELVQMNAAAS